jgi:hypothetical protein
VDSWNHHLAISLTARPNANHDVPSLSLTSMWCEEIEKMNIGGGILRKKIAGNTGEARGAAVPSSGRAVTFSTTPIKDVVAHRDNANKRQNESDESYDSDEVEDAILASGDGFSSSVVGGSKRRYREHNDDNDYDDADDDVNMNGDSAAFRSAAEIEEAKRRRGRARQILGESNERGVDNAKYDIDDDDNDGGSGSSSGWKDVDENDDDHKGGQGFSLITDQNADPDAYESNAAGNATCPVEPFNMDAEKEGGMGYFDGDTYIFRQNKKPIDGEEDAWLDGSSDDEERESGGGDILNSTAIWKPPSSSKTNDQSKRKAKFVSEDDSPEHLGRRLAELLQSDSETVMAALTRYGATMRDLQSQKQIILKRSQLKRRKRKSRSSHVAKEEDDDSTNDKESHVEDHSNNDAIIKELKLKVDQTRDTVEELTELADALLFGGETEAYELTKLDWIHRYKLDENIPMSLLAQLKRPMSIDNIQGHTQKKSRVGYFDTISNNNKTGNEEQQHAASDIYLPPKNEVTWEYKGNEDGSIHGPYTSRQMLEWTTCGYFIGESAVDIRRVGSTSVGRDDNKVDVDDLMADLLDDDDDDDDDDNDGKPENNASAASELASLCWMRSDEVDFSSYL